LLQALSSSLLSLLLVIALFWGGCISCEQFFMLGQWHGCCNPDAHCNRKAPAKLESELSYGLTQSLKLSVSGPAALQPDPYPRTSVAWGIGAAGGENPKLDLDRARLGLG